MPIDERVERGFNSKESSSRELKERMLVLGSIPTVHFANGPKCSRSKDTDRSEVVSVESCLIICCLHCMLLSFNTSSSLL